MMAGITISDDQFALIAAQLARDMAWGRLREMWADEDGFEAARAVYRTATAALRAICPHTEGFEDRGYGAPVCRTCGEEMAQ